MTDEQWSAFERWVEKTGGVVLWSGYGDFPGRGTKLGGLAGRVKGLRSVLESVAEGQLRDEARERRIGAKP